MQAEALPASSHLYTRSTAIMHSFMHLLQIDANSISGLQRFQRFFFNCSNNLNDYFNVEFWWNLNFNLWVFLIICLNVYISPPLILHNSLHLFCDKEDCFGKFVFKFSLQELPLRTLYIWDNHIPVCWGPRPNVNTLGICREYYPPVVSRLDHMLPLRLQPLLGVDWDSKDKTHGFWGSKR